MIKIKMRKNIYEEITEIEVSGHSGYAPRGQDIVCSSVSSLVYYLWQVLTELRAKATINERDGYTKVMLEEGMSLEIRAVLIAFENTVGELSSQYPNNVSASITWYGNV